MKRPRRLVASVAGALMLGLVAEAGAVDFSPTIEFTLGSNDTNANTTVRTVVKQETGEEELKSVELRVPAGFNLAPDQQLTNGETLGTGSIEIDVGPRCRGAGPLSAPATVSVTIEERDRTSDETQSGVLAVYVVDIQGVTSIPLSVYGSKDQGWRLEGPVPPNSDTCPPFVFDATFREKAQTSGTPIFTNPSSAGTHRFTAKFTSMEDSVVELEQDVQIKGPAGGGGGAVTDDDQTKKKKKKKKKCKKIEKKKKRKKCLKKLR